MDFGGYHITAKELANSMKPGGWLHSAVMEVGIQAITKNMTPSSNKVIMPLRIGVSTSHVQYEKLFFVLDMKMLITIFLFFFVSFAKTWLQNLDFNRHEMKELFSYERRLDKKDMV